MSTAIDTLPLTETITPKDQAEMRDAIQGAHASRTAMYPIGGGTSLDFGLPVKTPGIGLSLAGLDRVVDYPARDMTITVEAGITMSRLAEILAAEGQRLAVDPPLADRATLGGVVATGYSGPRRYGCGAIRDYVIGISAIDGRGTPFKGGGRVVKNVAGYDFCKLLTGSLGTLGVIVQVTLKVKPAPEQSALVACDVADFDQAETLLAELVNSDTTPSAIELVTGPAWRDEAGLLVGLEGTAAEVEWMIDRLSAEWRAHGVEQTRTYRDREAEELWSRLIEFPAQGSSPLVIKASLPPSRVAQFSKLVTKIDPECSIQAHAGNGIVIVRFAEFPPAEFSRTLIGRLQPAAANWGGSVVVVQCPAGELTRQAVWGGRTAAVEVMEAIKKQFDPYGLLNPGRFVYSEPIPA